MGHFKYFDIFDVRLLNKHATDLFGKPFLELAFEIIWFQKSFACLPSLFLIYEVFETADGLIYWRRWDTLSYHSHLLPLLWNNQNFAMEI